MTHKNDIETILDTLESRYKASVDRLRDALTAYADHGIRPDLKARDEGAFSYPELRIEYDPEIPPPTPARAFARLNQPGIYTSSIARPALFRAYLAEQLRLAGFILVEVDVSELQKAEAGVTCMSLVSDAGD